MNGGHRDARSAEGQGDRVSRKRPTSGLCGLRPDGDRRRSDGRSAAAGERARRASPRRTSSWPPRTRTPRRTTRATFTSTWADVPKTASSGMRAKLIGGIVEAIVRADAAAQPAALFAGIARQETPISFNRRFVMKDGSVRTWMRLDNPEVVRAAGPIDPDVGLLLVRAADGDQPLGVFTNFALHLDTVGGTLWSGDYPFFVEQSLRQTLGSEVISVFGNGCCGDINHADPLAAAVNKTDFIGQSLGETVQQ